MAAEAHLKGAVHFMEVSLFVGEAPSMAGVREDKHQDSPDLTIKNGDRKSVADRVRRKPPPF